MIVDISYWNGLPYVESPTNSGIDYDKLAAAILADPDPQNRGAILRVSSGDKVDLRFEQNYAELKARGVPLAGYHNFKPYASISVQASVCLGALAGKAFDFWLFKLATDIETPYAGWSQSVYAVNTLAMMQAIGSDAAYSAAWIWDLIIGNAAAGWINDYTLWAAHYTTAPQPILPVSWQGYDLWQYSADDNGLGSSYGLHSSGIDLNRFQVVAAPPDPDPSPQPDPFGLVYRVKTATLNVRAGPSTTAPDIGDLHQGDIIAALDILPISASSVWVKHGLGWSAMVHGGTWYLERK